MAAARAALVRSEISSRASAPASSDAHREAVGVGQVAGDEVDPALLEHRHHGVVERTSRSSLAITSVALLRRAWAMAFRSSGRSLRPFVPLSTSV